MALKTRRTSKPHRSERTVRKSKFQADLAPTEDRIVRGLKQELELGSNTDFLCVERVAPELTLPRVEISWTQQELENLAALASREPAAPTEALIRAMRG
jgi:hypothetical protein